MPKYFFLWVALVLCLGSSCMLHTGPTTRIRPSSAGMDLDMEKLQRFKGKYNVHYSGPVYNPSALLFLPRRNQERVELAMGWKTVDTPKELKQLQRSMQPTDPELWAIIPRGRRQDASTDRILAYIFTSGYASVQKLPQGEGYRILSLPEQFNHIYHDNRFPFLGPNLR